MRIFRKYFTIEPVVTPEASAVAYVPLVMVSRGLAFVRTLLVAGLLGKAGQVAWGLYQPALELINPLVALVMFGAADVAERYVARVQREHGHAGVRWWLTRKFLRVAAMGVLAFVLLAALSPWLSAGVWGTRERFLLVLCGGSVIALALYQLLSAVLRGLRAFGAAAGMELTGAILLLLLSAAAAPARNAPLLVAAYTLSVALPLATYGMLLWRFLRQTDSTPSPPAPSTEFPRMNRFAVWSLLRLLLVMLFGFLSFWGVRFVAETIPAADGVFQTSARTVAQYSMPYRIAQLLGFLAVTLWASSYGIAARTWSHERTRRAQVEVFRIARLGMAALTVIALALLLGRGLFERMLPPYAQAIETLLPGLLGLFIWYALVAFCSTLADLSERPWRGAALWGMAVAVQIAGIAIGHSGQMFGGDPKPHMLAVSAVGLLAALVLIAPLTVLRPVRFTATGVPLAVLALAAITLQCPAWVVDLIATPVLAGAVLFLYVSGLLIRKADLRAWRRGKSGRVPTSRPLL